MAEILKKKKSNSNIFYFVRYDSEYDNYRGGQPGHVTSDCESDFFHDDLDLESDLSNVLDKVKAKVNPSSAAEAPKAEAEPEMEEEGQSCQMDKHVEENESQGCQKGEKSKSEQKVDKSEEDSDVKARA